MNEPPRRVSPRNRRGPPRVAPPLLRFPVAIRGERPSKRSGRVIHLGGGSTAPPTARALIWASCRSSSGSRSCCNRTIRAKAPPCGGLRRRHRRHRRDPGRRPRILAGGVPEARRAHHRGAGGRRLRVAVSRQPSRLPVHALPRKPVLTLVTNVLYNTMLSDMETCYKVMRRRCWTASTCGPTASASSPKLRRKSSSAATASTRCPSPTTAAATTREEDHLEGRARGALGPDRNRIG